MIRVAIVDDEETIREGLSRMIRDLGGDFEIAGTARDGLEGLDLITRARPDVAIVDVKMPGFSGLDLVERARKSCPSTRFVVLSAHADFDYAIRAMRAGVVDYLEKPCNRFELLRALGGTEPAEGADAPEGGDPALRGRGPAGAGRPAPGALADAIRSFLDANFYREIGLAELAERFRLSPAYVSTLFKGAFGKGVVEYLHEIRVARAVELLEDPTLRVSEVARMVGFGDPRHFARVFKRITGSNPNEKSRT